jgi:hypothetical protein
MKQTGLPRYVIRIKTRHGKVLYYYRRRPRPLIRLHAEPGTLEFLRAVKTADSRTPRPDLFFGERGNIKSYVYFILYSNARVKIGTCKNVARRFAELQTGIPGKAHVHYVTPGNANLERDLHRKFAEDRVSGEWFRYSRAIRGWIKEDQDRRARERGWKKAREQTVKASQSAAASAAATEPALAPVN